MKRINKVLSILVAIILMLGTLPSNTALASDLMIESEDAVAEVKSYSTATMDDQFAENRILVVLNRATSSKLRTYDPTSFSEINAKSVKDLTQNTKEQLVTALQSSTKTRDTANNNDVPMLEYNRNYNQILSIELETAGKENVLKAIKALEMRDDILYVGPDYRIFSASTNIPNDAFFEDEQQEVADLIDLPEAWSLATGSSVVRVGVVDTGIDGSHPDLTNQVNTALSRDFSTGTEQTVTLTVDPVGHGTHVAGIIGAEGDNVTGVSGVCWDVELISLRVLDSYGYGFSSYVVDAVDYANATNIPILNMSIGWFMNWPEHVEIYNEPINVAIANYYGLVVCAAGNNTSNNDDNDIFPASYKLSNLISVANTTVDDELNDDYDYYNDRPVGSNYGKNTVHLAAPGTDIYSCLPGNYYDELTGTSMASPHVAGVAALILSIRPDLSAQEIKELILNNVDKVPALEEKCITGGRLNAYKAVLAATEAPTFTGDVNGDGRDDVILTRRVNGCRAITVYLGQSDGKFSEPITTQMTNYFYRDDPYYVGDFNGDGLTDVLVHWTSNGKRQLLVYLSNGDGTYSSGVNLSSTRNHSISYLPCTFHIADMNGDGKDDFIVHYRRSTGYTGILAYLGKSTAPYLTDATTDALITNELYHSNEPVYTGDFNGDGRDDLVLHRATESGKRQLRVYTGKPNGTFNAGVNLTSTRGHNPTYYPTKNFVTDVDGDGKDDFVVHWENQTDDRSNLVYKGTSVSPYLVDATTDALSSTNNYVETDPVYVGDINGDGKSDMVVHWVNSSGKRQLLIYIANSDGTYNAAIRHSTTTPHDPAQYSETMFIADINGDGRDDFVVKRRNERDSVQFLTYLGTAAGAFTTPITTTPTTFIPYFDSLPAYEAGIYKITNIGANRCLNINGDNVTSLTNNQNVTMWSDSGTNEQKWYIPTVGSSTYIRSVIDILFGLNVYRSGSPWNCDVYPIAGNETDALIDIIQTSQGFKIKLHNYDLYLTAASSTNGANVYWGAESTSTYQLWDLTLL